MPLEVTREAIVLFSLCESLLLHLHSSMHKNNNSSPMNVVGQEKEGGLSTKSTSKLAYRIKRTTTPRITYVGYIIDGDRGHEEISMYVVSSKLASKSSLLRTTADGGCIIVV